MKSLDKLLDYTIVTIDGYYGRLNDFLFDPNDWMVKYFKVDFGGILSSEFEMISQEFVREFNHDKKEMQLQITKNGIKDTATAQNSESSSVKEETDEDFELYYFQQIKGFHIYGGDDKLGSLEDFYVDNAWKILFAIIDVQNGLPWSKLVPVDTKLLQDFNYRSRIMNTNLNSGMLKEVPSFSLSELEDKFNEKELHDFYNQALT